MTEELKTPLHEEHISLGAKMGPFAGFSMPIQYSSVKDEALAVRNGAGLFDVSHMGEFLITGPEATKFADYLLCNDFQNAAPGKAVYSPLCREDGTVIDDMITYKLGHEKVLVCVNASNIQKDWDWFSKHADQFSCELQNLSTEYALVALQGPKSQDILTQVGLENCVDMESFSIKELQWRGRNIIVARTGYTGEEGVEIFCSPKSVQGLWQSLLEREAKPCGLAARDVLRLEACYPLYGHEIHDDVTPLDSNLKWTVKLNKTPFIGQKALGQYRPKYKLIKLTLEKGIPREHYPVYHKGNEVGRITSGTLSVSIGKGIALAHVSTEVPKDEMEFEVGIRKKMYPALRQKNSFIRGGQ